jgi:trimeric autotransporter adhesin
VLSKVGDALNNYGSVAGDAIGVTSGLADEAVAATALGSRLKPVSGLAGGETTAGMLGSGLGVAGGAAKIASGNLGGGVGDMAAGALQGGLGLMGKQTLGTVLGGASQAVGNVAEAARNVDQVNQGVLSNAAGGRNQFWGAMGDATIGAAHAATPLLGPMAPVGDLAITAGQLGLDTVGAAAGALGGDEWRFGAGDVVGAAEHVAYNAATSAPAKAVGKGLQTATGAAASGSGALLKGGGSLVSAVSPTLGNVAGGLTNIVGSGLSGAGNMVGGRTGAVLNAVGGGVSNYAAPAANALVSGAGQLVGGGLNLAGRGLSAVGSMLW